MKKTTIIFAFLFGIVPLFTKVKAQIEHDTLTIMTYNIQKQSYSENGKVIASVKPDVVAVQEIRTILSSNFSTLKKETGLDGTACATVGSTFLNSYYGIGLLWNPKLGTPTIKKVKIKSSKEDTDPQRAYILAEFKDFCIISTHYSLSLPDQIIMTNTILNDEIVQNCINSGKPIYIAGDLNPREDCASLKLFAANGFEILNDMDSPKHATRESGAKPDLILEKNPNPNREVIYRGVPDSADRTYTISDHLPYVVRIKK